MPRDGSFWRNVVLIGAAHVALLCGLARWGGNAKARAAADIVWMDGGAPPVTESAAFIPSPAPTDTLPSTIAEPDQPPIQEPEESAAPVEAKSDIELPSPPPLPSATPRAIVPPKPSPPATPKPKPTATPKKALLAKASPKPSATVAEKKKSDVGKMTAKAEMPKPAEAAAGTSVRGAGASPSNASAGAGAGSAGQPGWYGSMLHDRFFSDWVQPTSVLATGAKMSTLVRIRIEKDGRVSEFNIVRPSGNVVVDESVAAVAIRVTQVDPLPNGIGSSGHYDVNINFELNPEQ